MPIAFPFLPQWDAGITERLEWLTDVLPSRNGKEQRAGLRGHVRRQYDFAVAAASDADRVRLENALIVGQGGVVYMPVWPDASALGAGLSAGAVTIPVDTPYRDYAVDGLVGIISGAYIEVATIAAVAAGTLTVPPLVGDWPAGSLIVPLQPARMPESVRTTNPWLQVCQARVLFRCEAEWAITPASESADYLGYPALIPPDSWALDGDTEFQRDLEEFDPQIGGRAVFDLSGVSRTRRTYRIVLDSLAAVASFRAWLAARAGRRNPFWLVSGQDDLTLAASVTAVQTMLTIDNVGYASLGSIPLGRRDIMIETVGGQRYYRRILSAAGVDADHEQIVIDNALGISLAPADMGRISFMRLARLDTDAVEIAHRWPGAAESQIALRSLRDDV